MIGASLEAGSHTSIGLLLLTVLTLEASLHPSFSSILGVISSLCVPQASVLTLPVHSGKLPHVSVAVPFFQALWQKV